MMPSEEIEATFHIVEKRIFRCHCGKRHEPWAEALPDERNDWEEPKTYVLDEAGKKDYEQPIFVCEGLEEGETCNRAWLIKDKAKTGSLLGFWCHCMKVGDVYGHIVPKIDPKYHDCHRGMSDYIGRIQHTMRQLRATAREQQPELDEAWVRYFALIKVEK